jgi:hypothetical protein
MYSYVGVEATSQNSEMWVVLATMIGHIDGARMIISSLALGITIKIDMLEVRKTICYRSIPYHLYWFGITMPNPPAY